MWASEESKILRGPADGEAAQVGLAAAVHVAVLDAPPLVRVARLLEHGAVGVDLGAAEVGRDVERVGQPVDAGAGVALELVGQVLGEIGVGALVVGVGLDGGLGHGCARLLAAPASSSRRARLRILPEGLRGSSVRTISSLGILKPASFARQCCCSASRVSDGAGLEHDDGDGALAPALVGNADDGGVLHLRQLVDDALHLRGGDVLAAGDDHVLLAVGEIEEAVLVHVADVAAAQPIAEEGGARLLGVAPVAARDLGTAQADLAAFAGRERAAVLVADLDLDVGQRAADGADLLDLAAGLHQRVAAAGLGHAVSRRCSGLA